MTAMAWAESSLLIRITSRPVAVVPKIARMRGVRTICDLPREARRRDPSLAWISTEQN